MNFRDGNIALIIIPIVLIFLFAVTGYFWRQKLPMALPVVGNVEMSCKVDGDCSLVVRDSWVSCPKPSDVCSKPDFSQDKWTAVNQSWYEPQIKSCPQFDCPSWMSSLFIAKCVNDVCQKVPLFQPPSKLCHEDKDCAPGYTCPVSECDRNAPGGVDCEVALATCVKSP